MSRVPPFRFKLKADVPAPPVRVIFPPIVRVPPDTFTFAVAVVLAAAEAPEIEAIETVPAVILMIPFASGAPLTEEAAVAMVTAPTVDVLDPKNSIKPWTVPPKLVAPCRAKSTVPIFTVPPPKEARPTIFPAMVSVLPTRLSLALPLNDLLAILRVVASNIPVSKSKEPEPAPLVSVMAAALSRLPIVTVLRYKSAE